MSSHGHDVPANEVQTDSFSQTVLGHCENQADEWAFTVKGRIEYFGNDLLAADCRTGRNIPEQLKTGSWAKRKSLGQPKNEDQQRAFLRMCEYLERTDEEQLTISDLVSKMRGYLLEDGSAPYGNQYIEKTPKGHYDDSIYVAEGLP